jgi:hypothetical protein
VTRGITVLIFAFLRVFHNFNCWSLLCTGVAQNVQGPGPSASHRILPHVKQLVNKGWIVARHGQSCRVLVEVCDVDGFDGRSRLGC